MATLEQLFQPVQPKSDDNGNKVTVVGTGQVGMAAVFSMLTQVIFFSLHLLSLDILLTDELVNASRLKIYSRIYE